MRVSRRRFLQASGVAGMGARGIRAQKGPVSIFVDPAPFSSVEEAAAAEERVDWRGSDVRAMNACTQSFAAMELRAYLRRLVSGEEFSMAVPKATDAAGFYILSLSDSSPSAAARAIIEREKLASRLPVSGSFALVPRRGSLYLIGKDRAGALYAVYHFLEMQGIRWYEPGDENTYIPRAASLKMPPATVIQSPKMFSRGFMVSGKRVTRDFHLWMAHNRLNLWTNSEGSQPWLKKLGLLLTDGGHGEFPRYINPQAEYPYAHPLFPASSGKPPDPYKVDRIAFLGDADHDGKLSFWEAHPEWYGVENGVRRPFRNGEDLNPCLANDDMLAEVFKGINHELAAGRWLYVDQLNFWGLDSHKWCECDKCQALGSVTDRMVRVIHMLRQSIVRARQAGELQRDVKVVFAMYHETLAPPTRPLPADFDYENCIGTMFPITRCYGHVIDDPKCTEYNTTVWKQMTAWRQDFSKGQLIIGEYYNISRTKSLPVMHTRIMAHDIPLYYSLGARNMHYMHVSYPHNGPKRWRDYFYARLLWDPSTAIEPWFREYLRDFYGESAAAPMGEFYEHLEAAMSPITSWRGYTPRLTTLLLTNQDPESLEHLKIKETHPPQNDGVDLEESVAHLARCRAIVDGLLQRSLPEPYAGRLREDDKHLRYGENTAGFYYRVAQAAQTRRHGDLEAARAFWRQAKVHAEGLLQEKEIVQTASFDGRAKDGLDATQLQDYFGQLGKDLQVE